VKPQGIKRSCGVLIELGGFAEGDGKNPAPVGKEGEESVVTLGRKGRGKTDP